MKNIVFLVGSYHPNYSAVGRCQGNLAEEFEKRGYNVTVIAQKTVSDEAEEAWFNKQHIFRIKTKDLQGDMNCREQLKTGNKKFLIKHKLYQIKRVLKIVFSKNSLDKALVKAYNDELCRLETKPDLIIPTCQPFETVIAAIKYKELYGECKIVPILYDMFSQSHTLHRFGWNKKLKEKANILLERKMLETCDKVLHMPVWTCVIKKFFEDLVHKTEEIEHPLVFERESVTAEAFDPGTLDIVYTGVVDNKLRNPDSALNFFDCDVFDGIKVHFYSLGSAQNRVDTVSKSSKVVISHGRVPNNIAQDAMYGSDALLSIGNNSNVQMPSKIFEYMSTGKPIVHISQVDNDLACKVLEKYPMSFVIPFDVSNIEETRNEVRNFLLCHKGEQIPFETVRQIYKEADVDTIVSNIINDYLK